MPPAPDGTTGALQTAGAAEGIYKTVNPVPDSLIGLRGTLALDSAGRALTLVPAADVSQKSFVVSSAAGTYITCSDGTRLSVPDLVTTYLNGETREYSEIWVELSAGTYGTAYFSASGTMEYLVLSHRRRGYFRRNGLKKHFFFRQPLRHNVFPSFGHLPDHKKQYRGFPPPLSGSMTLRPTTRTRRLFTFRIFGLRASMKTRPPIPKRRQRSK